MVTYIELSELYKLNTVENLKNKMKDIHTQMALIGVKGNSIELRVHNDLGKKYSSLGGAVIGGEQTIHINQAVDDVYVPSCVNNVNLSGDKFKSVYIQPSKNAYSNMLIGLDRIISFDMHIPVRLYGGITLHKFDGIWETIVDKMQLYSDTLCVFEFELRKCRIKEITYNKGVYVYDGYRRAYIKVNLLSDTVRSCIQNITGSKLKHITITCRGIVDGKLALDIGITDINDKLIQIAVLINNGSEDASSNRYIQMSKDESTEFMHNISEVNASNLSSMGIKVTVLNGG